MYPGSIESIHVVYNVHVIDKREGRDGRRVRR